MNAIRDAVVSTYKMAAQTHAVRCLFCQLRKWAPARMLGRVCRPVRPLVLIYITLWTWSGMTFLHGLGLLVKLAQEVALWNLQYSEVINYLQEIIQVFFIRCNMRCNRPLNLNVCHTANSQMGCIRIIGYGVHENALDPWTVP